MMSPAEFAAKLTRAAASLKTEMAAAAKVAAEAGAEHSRSLIGNGAEGWAPLAEATLERKAAGGYPVPSPLLREGGMQGSISSDAAVSGEGAEGLIYATDTVAIYQELGTSSNPQGSPIPPRPFLMKGAMHAIEVVGPLLVEALERAIGA